MELGHLEFEDVNL